MSDALLPAYSVDASSWIELDKSYNVEFFPTLWDRLSDLAAEQRLLTSETVRDEIDDEWLRRWIVKTPGLVRRLDHVQQAHVRTILNTHADLVDPTKTRQDADPFVIALALAEAGSLAGSGRACHVIANE